MRTSFFLLLFLRFVLLEFSIHILQRGLKLNKLPLNQGLLKLEPVRLLDDKLLDYDVARRDFYAVYLNVFWMRPR